jgi:hypothetical protein
VPLARFGHTITQGKPHSHLHFQFPSRRSFSLVVPQETQENILSLATRMRSILLALSGAS